MRLAAAAFLLCIAWLPLGLAAAAAPPHLRRLFADVPSEPVHHRHHTNDVTHAMHQLFHKTTADRLRPREPYSTVDCRQERPEPGVPAQCFFSNVGYANNSILFYENPHNPVTYITPNIKYEFPVNLTGIRGGTLDPHYIPVVKVRGPVPADAVYADVELAYLLVPFWPENPGHWLVDDLLASFTSLVELGIYVADPLLVIAKGCADYYGAAEPWRAPALEHCYDAYLTRSKGWSRRDPLFLTENPYAGGPAHDWNTHLQTAYRESRLHFANAVAGHSAYALVKGGSRRSLHWHLFRHMFLHNFGLAEPHIGSHHITLVKKHGRRHIVNFDAVLHALRGYGVPVSVLDPATMAWDDQVRAILNTTLLVSVPGGVSFQAGFLQSTSVALFFDMWSVDTNASVSMEGFWWEHLAAFRTLRYMYNASEAVFPDAAVRPHLLTDEMKSRIGLGGIANVTEHDLHTTPNAMTNLYSMYTDLNVDIGHFGAIVCEALAIAETNKKWSHSYDYAACGRQGE